MIIDGFDFPDGAEDYYNLEKAAKWLASPIPDGYARWRCVLCGWGMDLTPKQEEIAPCCGCGGCGQTCLRPIAEYVDQLLDSNTPTELESNHGTTQPDTDPKS